MLDTKFFIDKSPMNKINTKLKLYSLVLEIYLITSLFSTVLKQCFILEVVVFNTKYKLIISITIYKVFKHSPEYSSKYFSEVTC